MQPFIGIAHMLSYSFMIYAFVAGGMIAIASGFVGYFLTLRSQVFTGDALGHVAFSGALAALALGADLRVGLYASCIAVAIIMAVIARRAIADDVVIGNVFAFVLGLGVLFLSIFSTQASSSANDTAGVNVLFGSILGFSKSETITDSVIAVGVIMIMTAIGRPLLFATVDAAVAEARGVPVKLLGIGFLATVGVTAGAATEAIGALLLLGLLATPAAAAQQLTDRPYVALGLSAVISLASVWIGLALSYAFAQLPPSFAILATATTFAIGSWWWRSWRHRARPAPSAQRDLHSPLGNQPSRSAI